MNPEEYCLNLHKYFDSEAIIKVTVPPAYISNLKIQNQEDPIILVYKEEKPKDNALLNQINLANISGIEESIGDLSITGQPLEYPFKNDDTSLNSTIVADPVVAEHCYHAPLSMLDARKCLSIVNLKMIPPLPVWIFTDMSDIGKTYLLGSEIKSNWRTRSWAIAHSNQSERIPINNMFENFETTFKINSGYKKTSTVSCMFNIKDQPGMAKNGKCFLEVNWEKPSYEVPVSQADTSLLLECVVGHEESQVSRWWQQLNLLQKYMEIIKEYKGAQKVQFTYQKNSIQLPSFIPDGETKLPLLSRVMDLLKRSDSMSVCRQLASTRNTTSAFNSTIHELLDKQKGQDFTDKLWSLLIEAETYQELIESFQLVLREVRKQGVKPYIFAKNKTRLASLLCSLKTSSSELELMMEPLELMVEMGIEKLKRDYMFIILASQMANEESLSLPKMPSFCEVSSDQWQATVDVWLSWLAQLHTVLELISLIHTTMSTSTLVQVTSLALSTYVNVNSPVSSLVHLINNRTYYLRAPVISKEVKTFIEGDKTFYKWLLQLSAVSNSSRITSTYVLLQESPLPLKVLTEILDTSEDNTEVFSETLNQTSMSCFSKEKYTYIQLCSIAEKLPY